MSYTSSIWHHLLQHRLYQLSYPTTLLTANHICRTFHRCRHSASQINSRQSSDTKASSGDGVVRRSFHSSSVSYVKQSIMLKSEVQRGKNVNVLVDQGWADQIVDMLQTHFDVADPSTVIFDSNTGDAILSRELLRRGAQRVIGWESRDKYWPALQDMEIDYDGRFLMQKRCYLRSKKMINQPVDHSRDGPFKNVPVLDWGDVSPLKVVGVTSCHVMMAYIVLHVISLARQAGLCAYGRVEHYLLLTGMEHKLLSDLNAKWINMLMTRVVFYKLFYDHETLMKVPIKAFSPSRVSRGWKNMEWDSDHLYLIKLSLKRDIFDAVCPLADLPVFINMLTELNRRKKDRLIPLLDTWCPGFGLALIEMGYDMMDRVRNVPMDQLPVIYKAMLTSPSYKRSGLKVSLEHNVCQTSQQ